MRTHLFFPLAKMGTPQTGMGPRIPSPFYRGEGTGTCCIRKRSRRCSCSPSPKELRLSSWAQQGGNGGRTVASQNAVPMSSRAAVTEWTVQLGW